jgi:hypothetical protein
MSVRTGFFIFRKPAVLAKRVLNKYFDMYLQCKYLIV